MPSIKDNTVEEFAADPVVEVVADAAPAKKPYGQNPGDIVDANEAVGGQYEAVGAGKMRRIN